MREHTASARTDTLRLFWAIDLPAEVKGLLAFLQARGRMLAPQASWPDTRNLHLTLAFLGEVPKSQVKKLLEAGREAVSLHQRFRLRTTELGGFPNSHTARVLWLGVEPEAATATLALELRRAMASLGQPTDEKPFKPHLTLARFKTPMQVSLFERVPSSIELEVNEVLLYQSQLQPKGSLYTCLGKANLA